ncbi:MAG: hypothetical protein ACK47N_04910 [Microcystis sp.]|uniref:hypothetical protein n=1 Tax=Microcystis sp. TaxID=1127 RepID=UPI003919834C
MRKLLSLLFSPKKPKVKPLNQLSVISYQLSVISEQLSVSSYQLSVSSYQLESVRSM